MNAIIQRMFECRIEVHPTAKVGDVVVYGGSPHRITRLVEPSADYSWRRDAYAVDVSSDGIAEIRFLILAMAITGALFGLMLAHTVYFMLR